LSKGTYEKQLPGGLYFAQAMVHPLQAEKKVDLWNVKLNLNPF
jgi:hypothetical protein